MLSDRVWQPLPGEGNAEIYPLVRKPDVTCSNAFLIRTKKELLLLDIGGTREQAGEIRRIIALEGSNPLYCILTHCHIDHCFPVLCGDETLIGRPCILMMHENGAVALETADGSRILADLFGKEISPVRVPVHLFDKDPSEEGQSRIFFCGGRNPITIVPGCHSTADCGTIPTECFSLPSGLSLVIYHMPGHSPDSICIRIGSALFTGDLFFATAPGVAGLPGFDQKSLLHSLSQISAILEEGGVTMVCSAHGSPLPVKAALSALPGLKQECRSLASVGVFDRDRMDASRLHAEEILDEACRLFSVIAGRILSVCYHLEEIDEDIEAERIRAILDIGRIERILDELSAFHGAFKAGEKHDIQFILKAVQMLDKFRTALNSSQISSIIDLPLVNRATRFFDEFMQTVQGKPIEARMELVAINGMLESLLYEYHAPLCSDEDLIDAADDEELYRQAMSRRLSDHDRFVAEVIEFHPDPSAGAVLMDRLFLTDVLMWMLEDLALNGYEKINLATSRDDQVVLLSVEGSHPDVCSSFCSERRWWVWDRKVRYSGGDLCPPAWEPGKARIMITMRAGD